MLYCFSPNLRPMWRNWYLPTWKVLRTDGVTSWIEDPIYCHNKLQDGVAGHKYKYIVETDVSLLPKSSLHIQFWLRLYATAVFLINHLPSRSVLLKSSCKNLLIIPDCSFQGFLDVLAVLISNITISINYNIKLNNVYF